MVNYSSLAGKMFSKHSGPDEASQRLITSEAVTEAAPGMQSPTAEGDLLYGPYVSIT